MNMFLKIALVIAAVVLALTGVFTFGLFDAVMDSDIGGRGAVGKTLFKSIPVIMLPAICLAAANTLDENPFMSREFLTRLLLFLAIAHPISQFVSSYTYLESLITNKYNHMSQIESIGRLVGYIARTAAMSLLALFFAQKLKEKKPIDDGIFGHD